MNLFCIFQILLFLIGIDVAWPGHDLILLFLAKAFDE